MFKRASIPLVCLFTLAMPTAGCGSDAIEGCGTDAACGTGTESGTGGSSGGGTSTSGTSTSTSGTGTGTASGTSGTGTTGTTSGGTTSGGTGGSTSGGTGGSTSGGTGGSTSGGTTGGSQACTMTHEFVLEAKDATLSGDWELVQSMFGEGEVAALGFGPGTDGSVLWEPEIPCADTWHVHVRYFDQGTADSYLVQVDGEPMPPAIFEGDCTAQGNGYGWRELNWRDEGANPCEYVEDPWTFLWEPGVYSVEFSYRESAAIARIVVTNDPNWAP